MSTKFRYALSVLSSIYLLIRSINAQAAHPLITEDASVQGQGKQQIELNTSQWTKADVSSQIANLTYTYGALDALDLFVALPAALTSPQGINDVSIGSKYVFAESSNTNWALKAELFFSTGNAKKGLGNDSHDIALTLIQSMTSTSWVWHNNIALLKHHYQQNNAYIEHRDLVWKASTALMLAVNKQWQLVADMGLAQADHFTDRKPSHHMVLGIIYSPNSSLDLDIGITRLHNNLRTEHLLGIGLAKRY